MISAVEQVESCLSGITKHDDRLRATITVMADEARAAAERCDAAAAEGRWLGLLHGTPIALKDNIATAGVRTTSGSRFFADHVPDQDAAVAARLRAAGAILIAKTNLAEFALGATTQNPHYGSCRTPWDPDRVPGGSSGGSAAAVAAGMAVAALGTDTGASVRLPGALNGVVGLRPTTGRVSNHGTTPASPSLDTVGPLAYRVEDVARILAVIEGYDRRDPSSVDGPRDPILSQLDDGVSGMRIGVPASYFFEDIDDGVDTVVRAALDRLSNLGAHVQQVDLEGAAKVQVMTQRIIFPDLAAFHATRLSEAPDDFGPDLLRGLREIGMATTGVQYAEAMAWRSRWRRRVHRMLVDVDLIATPVAPTVAPRVDELDKHALGSPLVSLTNAWSLADVPAVSVPCGFSDGLPVGLQLIGPPWQDGRVLRAAAAYQHSTEWHTHRPALIG